MKIQNIPPRTIVAASPCKMLKVMIEDGMEVEEGKLLLVYKCRQIFASCCQSPTLTLSEKYKSMMKAVLDWNPPAGVYSMEDVLIDPNAENDPMSSLADVGVQNENFSKFDTVMGHKDHLFSAMTSPRNQASVYVSPPSKEWENKIHQEWRILEEGLPDTIFVRVDKSRMDLLRAAIIGAKGTPYHDGLFFFDVFFPSTYPDMPPLVRYHSGGLSIHPNVLKCGEVRLRLFKSFGSEINKMWVPGTSNMLQFLVSIQNLILNPKPYFDRQGFAILRGTVDGEICSLLYNENIFIRSLKTMVYTMQKPPKNFEALVVGHFRKHAFNILKACEAYTEGMQVGCFGSEDKLNKETCSNEFKNDVVRCIKPLVAAFKNIGAMEAEDFFHLSEKIIPVPVVPSVPAAPTTGTGKRFKRRKVYLNSPSTFVVDKVLVKEGMNVEKGDPLYSVKASKKEESTVATSSSATQSDSMDLDDNSGMV